MKITFLGLLAIVFIALKLSGHIAWSWLWVLSPLWLPWAVLAVIGLISVCFALIASR